MINRGARIPTGPTTGRTDASNAAVYANTAVNAAPATPTVTNDAVLPRVGPVTNLELGPRPARPALPTLSSARAGVLRAVTAAGTAVTVSALAEQLGQHPNTIREHLDALVDDEFLQRVRSSPSGRGRPAWLYRPPAHGPAGPGDLMAGPLGDGGHEYLALAVALMDQVANSSPDPETLARRAGERWGRTLADRLGQVADATAADDDPADRAAPAVEGDRTAAGESGSAAACDGSPAEAVLEMLRSLRFGPERADDPKRIRLTTCPLLDAARRHPGVVCQVHAGIVRGALERLGGDPDGTQLVAFAEPGACLLTLPNVR